MEIIHESFVYHAEYIHEIPDELKPIWAYYAVAYGIYADEPKLSGIEIALWAKIKKRIDYDKQNYENTIKQRSEAGKRHKGNQYTKNGTKWNEVERVGTNGTVNVNVNVNDNVNESVNGSVNVLDKETTTKIFSKYSLSDSTVLAINQSLQERHLDSDFVLFVDQALRNRKFKGQSFATKPENEKRALFIKAVTDWQDLATDYKTKGFEALQGANNDELPESFIVNF